MDQKSFTNTKARREIERAKALPAAGTTRAYGDRDVILYHLSVGAPATDLSLLYERHPSFHVLPTFSVIPWFGSSTPWELGNIVKNFSPTTQLHGEHYMELRRSPIPTGAQTITFPKLLDVVDKGHSAIVLEGYTTRDARTGEDLFYNESTIYLRGSGGFGGSSQSAVLRPRAATAPYRPPRRRPDVTIQDIIPVEMSRLYRLNRDRHPVHIDPNASRASGFERPFLHGLQLLGVAGRHVFGQYGHFTSLKVRFAGVVFPGQTIRTDMWREAHTVIFQTVVVQTGKLVLSSAGVELEQGPIASL